MFGSFGRKRAARLSNSSARSFLFFSDWRRPAGSEHRAGLAPRPGCACRLLRPRRSCLPDAAYRAIEFALQARDIEWRWRTGWRHVCWLIPKSQHFCAERAARGKRANPACRARGDCTPSKRERQLGLSGAGACWRLRGLFRLTCIGSSSRRGLRRLGLFRRRCGGRCRIGGSAFGFGGLLVHAASAATNAKRDHSGASFSWIILHGAAI